MSMTEKQILAVDIGGSKIMAGIVDHSGNVLSGFRENLPENYNVEYVIDTICDLAKKAGIEKASAAGVTIPGLADVKTGMWCYAPFSSIANIPIVDILEKRLGIPVFIENDVNACAVAEMYYGTCRDSGSFLWVTVSNGVGGAVVLDGKLVSGESCSAGEIGHFIVEDNTSRRCGCGRCGCLEAMSSGRGISQSYFELTGRRADAREIAEKAYREEAAASEAFAIAGRYLGKAISYCVNLLNISHIVIGGGVSQSFDLLKEPIEESLNRYVFAQANKKICLESTKLGYNAALLGAAAVAYKNLKGMQNE